MPQGAAMFLVGVSPVGGAIRCVSGHGQMMKKHLGLRAEVRVQEGAPDLLISYSWYWDVMVCPEGGHTRRIITRFYYLPF